MAHAESERSRPRIVVVGAGNAGIPAAIVAAELGADVTLVEKTDRIGGMLWVSSATVSAAGTRMQRAKGIEDSPEKHAEDALHIGRGRNDPALVRLATTYAAETVDWLEALGAPYSADSPVFAGEHELYSVPRSYRCNGIEYIKVLQPELERHRDRIDLRLNTRVVDLLEKDGRVAGVRLEHAGEVTDLPADAVILATGGYAANRELLARFHGADKRVVTACLDHATGDGLVMAEKAGAALVNMDVLILMPGGVEDPRRPGFTLSWSILTRLRAPGRSGDVWVNREGRRFMREDEPSPDARERAIMAQPGTEMVAIFDEPMRQGLAPDIAEATRHWLEGGAGFEPVIISAPTIAELATKLGLDPQTLEATIARYNSAVAEGRDAEFHRESLPKAVDTPPFHAVRAYGVTLGTNGGVKVDDRLRVVRGDGTPIEGLYAAGEILGKAQLMGDGVASGFAAGPAFTFGRLAARFAVEASRASAPTEAAAAS
ncbi:MAG: flavocytochrome c [Dehalococcoidia bacterium]|nr:MAG: flavocytochrome c [Dehalococcoidia bacterium]